MAHPQKLRVVMIRVEPIICEALPRWLARDWDRLQDASHKPSFQLEFEVAAAWARHLRGLWKILLLLTYNGDAVIGIFPLMYLDQRRRGLLPFRRIRFLANTHSDFSGILAAPSNVGLVAEASLVWLNAGELRWELLVLDDLEGSDPAVGAITAALEKVRAPTERHEGRYYFVDLERPWEQVWADMSKKFVRRNVSLARNRIARAGVWRRLDNPSWSIDEIIAKAAAIHQSRQAELGRESQYRDASWRAFVQEALAHHASRGRLRTHWLELDGTLIAYLIGFIDERVYYAWNIAFLPHYAEFYPSRFLFAEVIRDCHAQGLKSFSFMRGESDYKAKWSSRYESNVRLTVHRTDHVYGKLIHLLDRVSGGSRSAA